MGSSGRVAGVVALVALLGAGAAVTPSDGDGAGLPRRARERATTRRAARPVAAVRALAALEDLPVRARAARPAAAVRARSAAWPDPDGDGCDVHDDVMRRDLRGGVLTDDGCSVETGTLTDPYTGAVVRYPGVALRVDRLVSAEGAWATGAGRLTAARREQLAADPLNLLLTTATAADRRAGADAAGWLPRRAFRCTYVARQVAVKRAYRLWVTPAERAAMVRVLSGCPGQALPAATAATPSLVARSPLPTPQEPDAWDAGGSPSADDAATGGAGDGPEPEPVDPAGATDAAPVQVVRTTPALRNPVPSPSPVAPDDAFTR